MRILHFVERDSVESVDASLRYASFSMTRQCHSERSEESSAMRILHFVERDSVESVDASLRYASFIMTEWSPSECQTKSSKTAIGNHSALRFSQYHFLHFHQPTP